MSQVVCLSMSRSDQANRLACLSERRLVLGGRNTALRESLGIWNVVRYLALEASAQVQVRSKFDQECRVLPDASRCDASPSLLKS